MRCNVKKALLLIKTSYSAQSSFLCPSYMSSLVVSDQVVTTGVVCANLELFQGIDEAGSVPGFVTC